MKLTKNEILGENLSILRNRENKSPCDVSGGTGISPSTIQRLENGSIKKVSTDYILKLTDYYNYGGDIRKLYERVLDD